jgi:hypothetical protein
MKSYATFFITAVMIAAVLFLLVTRDRPNHDAPAEVVAAPEDAGVDAGSSVDAGLAAAEAGAKPADKPIRVASLGWELVASGAAMTPPDGGAPHAPAPPIELAPEGALDAIEARLARGGADPQGADVAVLPLPAFVASYEKLRALEPRAFLVVGFSHGREEVHALPGALLKAPPAAEEVRLVATNAEAATVLGLFALDLLGVAPTRVRLVSPESPDAKGAAFSALVKGIVDERKLAFSTVDASRFVPIVAVAPKSLIDGREFALREWSKAWLEGLALAGKDAPGTARRLAAKEALPMAASVGGAPEALALVERLGQIENMTLADQASWIGPLAKSAVTLETLTQRTWQLARGGGLTASATPEPLPIDARVVAAIAPPSKVVPPAPPGSEGDGGVVFSTIPSAAAPLVAYRAAEGDTEKIAAQIAFLAGVFDRAAFRISAKGGEKAARVIATAARDKGVPASRLGLAPGEPGVLANVEILAPP